MNTYEQDTRQYGSVPLAANASDSDLDLRYRYFKGIEKVDDPRIALAREFAKACVRAERLRRKSP